jgi:hypothetical protein
VSQFNVDPWSPDVGDVSQIATIRNLLNGRHPLDSPGKK